MTSDSEEPGRTTPPAWPGFRSATGRGAAPGQRRVFPGPVPAALRALGDPVRAVDWPSRPAFRSSRLALLDTLCRWQTVRVLAYVRALAAGAADTGLLEGLRVVPGPETAAHPDAHALVEHLEAAALGLPALLLDAVVRDAGRFVAHNRFSAPIIAAALAADSQPADTDEAAARAGVLTGYWYETPALRGGLALAGSANGFVGSWLWWSASFTYGDPAGGIGITTDPPSPFPAAAALPAWAAPLLAAAATPPMDGA
ncbi:hypothetical protein EF903_23405 [Streptomyces sp. WAC05292]|uniref:hypothetical protein n=1 Tax=Streptomyces sp. WAC05292 TaxID=2487418 RepID=UPI000F73759D|nr:hypothetical protein [Streptomyces sp. WAC05292]RSS84685.1 hypothetical protein EF903_23405 [Streptomyces sp. WAC05292]